MFERFAFWFAVFFLVSGLVVGMPLISTAVAALWIWFFLLMLLVAWERTNGGRRWREMGPDNE